MSNPLPVTIVRPSSSAGESFTDFIVSLVMLAARAWLVMVLVPHFTPWHPSYWQTVGVCLVIGTLNHDDSYVLWSKRTSR